MLEMYAAVRIVQSKNAQGLPTLKDNMVTLVHVLQNIFTIIKVQHDFAAAHYKQ